MFDRDKVWLGITPTVWTNDDFPLLGDEIPFEQCISEIALAGFQGCSVGHKFPTDRGELKRQLDLRGLRVSEPWVSTYFTMRNMHERTVEAFQSQIEFIRDMGGTDIVLAELGHAVHQQPVTPISNKPVFNNDQWQAMVDGLNYLGRMAAEQGMRVCYHHHIGTGVMTRADVDRLMEETDPEVVFLLLDTGHLYWVGDDPLDMTKAYADRIKHVHLKDIRRDVMERSARDTLSFGESILEGVFTVPGDGAIDFKPILQVLADRGYEGWLTVEAEQDHRKAHPLSYAMKARAHLRELTGL
jgi:inosose dehydratase